MITYHLVGGDDPWGGQSHTVESPRLLIDGETIYCNARWFRVKRAGLMCAGGLCTDEQYAVILEAIP